MMELEEHHDEDVMMERLRQWVDNGNVSPLPTDWGNSCYLYADDYYRHKHGLPLRERAAGQYYLDGDTYANERTLPYKSQPMTHTADGMMIDPT
jgi:hypothetical protein